MLNNLVGIGMRPAHYERLTSEKINIGWLEVHSENHFEINSEATYYLDKASERYPISLHGIGLSLMSHELIDTIHVGNIKKLITRYQPFNISEHLTWSDIAGQHYHRAISVPYTEESLKHVIERINLIQNILEHEIAIENPPNYQVNDDNTLTELAFFSELHKATQCKLLLDINNVHISSCHLNFDPFSYINEIPTGIVNEIHLSGSRNTNTSRKPNFVEHKGHKINTPVWRLFSQFLQQNESLPTLIERDINIPSLNELLQEARLAQELILRTKKLHKAS